MPRPPILARAVLAALILGGSVSSAGAEIPTPESHLGFRPGADFHLARWEQVVGYFQAVDAASDRVLVRSLGETTEGRPYLVAIVASPETIARLDRFQALQRLVADPRRDPSGQGLMLDPDAVVAESRPVVLITCTIHSSETASTLMATELLHDLATGEDPATREVLDNTILLLVPSANPDGVDKVADWYEKSRGTPYEGSGMPWLYHTYAGHDTNRDWFMLNLKETRLLTRLLYREWFPTITYDVHQMGSTGARFFVPPFHDPVNPNLDPRVSQSIMLIGAHMAADLARAGKTGVLTNAMYDNWWSGGNRTVPQRHNMVGVLTEAASVRLASPIFLEPGDLRGTARGFPNHDPAVNFVDPWPGGWWRLRDIVEYQLICARSVLTLAARYRDKFQTQYRAMAADSIAAGRAGPPYGWVVPADQRDPARAADMVRILHETGIDVHRTDAPFEAAGRTFPPGSWVLSAAQPYRAHLKDVMERQDYPDRLTGSGTPETPYDVAGWTLPFQMGVESVEIATPFEPPGTPLSEIKPPAGQIVGTEKPASFVVENRTDDDLILLGALQRAGVEVRVALQQHPAGGASRPAGSYFFAAGAATSEVLEEFLPGLSSRVHGLEKPLAENDESALPTRKAPAPRIGLYQPWVPSMDEGWTRLVLENFQFPYTTLHNADVRSGRLRERFDAIILPSVGRATLRNGYAPDASAPDYVGGLGPDGAQALRDFARAGGTVVCLESSCQYAIAEWNLPVKEVLSGLKSSEFYGPGSVVRVEYPLTGKTGEVLPLTFGMPTDGYAYFNGSLAFDATDSDLATVVARYADHNVLASGWLRGAERLEGKAAVVDVELGDGRVILFGFPPQHRAQTRGTFRLLFNALLSSAYAPAD